MDPTRISATITTLMNQRNDALNAVVQATVEAEILRLRVADLESRLAKLESAPEPAEAVE